MMLRYPLGLLGLIGIPILIIIYIIKSKYTEQTLASTYLWRLSDRFLKNKHNKKSISGLISLILQIIGVIAISLIISQPVITLHNAANEYCFLLDASGSMNMEANGKTRLELGKEKIEEIIDDSTKGSTYTIIALKAKPEVILERNSDKLKTKEFLSSIAPTDISISLKHSLGYAQYYFDENKGIKTYLVTDKELDNSDNVNVINVSSNESNYAIMNTAINLIAGENTLPALEIKGNLYSYNEDAVLNVSLYVDDIKVESKSIECKKGKETEFLFTRADASYKKLRVAIENKDGLMSDNEEIFYNIKESHSYNALIVSNHPAYISNILKSDANLSVTLMTPDEYLGIDNPSGYSLYVFDSFNPKSLPKDGAIWLFGLEENLEGSGFTVQTPATDDSEFINIELNKSTGSLFKKLTNGLIGSEVAVKRYNSYGLIRSFTVLYEYEKIPMIFTGTNDYGNREVVFAFDLHDSNFALQLDYITLAKNLINYTFPVIMDKANYVCGDTMLVNILSSCDSIRIESPSGRASYLDTSEVVGEYMLAECGSYKLTMRFNEDEKIFNVFASLPEKESFDSAKEEYKLAGEAENKPFDGYYDELIALFIVLAVIYMADWMVYCYEQYQLR